MYAYYRQPCNRLPPLLFASVTGRVTYSKAGPIVSSNTVDSNQYAEQSERVGSPPVHSEFYPSQW